VARIDTDGPACVARSWVPGHLTGLFAPARSGRDPRARGSVGAGIVLSAGVEARAAWAPGERPAIALRSDAHRPLPISRDAAERLLAGRSGRLDIALAHELPIGQGLGMSAAGALATALAVAEVLGIERPHAVEVAHLADLFGGGGLGGVAAILGGGFELRTEPGVPPYGAVTHRPFRHRVVLVEAGPPMPTSTRLADDALLERLGVAGREALAELLRRPTAARLLELSEGFTDSAGIGSAGTRRWISALRADGAWAGQAMFGRCVWAVPRSRAALARIERRLLGAGVRAAILPASRTGPTVARVDPPQGRRPGPAAPRSPKGHKPGPGRRALP
jgi:pantoate kinase